MLKIIKNCRFVPALTEGTSLEMGDIFLRDGVIDRIAPCGAAPGEACEELDVEGATVLPGLINMHLHLFDSADYTSQILESAPEKTFDCYNYAKNLLDYGYTTLRDCGDDVSCPTVALSRAVEKGIITGPRIVPSCGTICPHEPGVEVLDFIIEYLDGGTDDMRRLCRKNFQKGAQFIKLYGSGSMMAAGSEPGKRILEADEISEAVKMAERKDTYVAIHAHGAETIDTAVKCGVRTIEHASLISEETLCYMDSRKDQVGIVPTLAVFFSMMQQTDSEDANTSFFAKRAARLGEQITECLKNAYRHGILIGWGTDVSLAAFCSDPGAEFRYRKGKLECSNEDILRQVTINSAKLMKLDDQIGSIKCGKCADLVVIKGDPLEDISVMYEKPLHVIKGGQIIR